MTGRTHTELAAIARRLCGCKQCMNPEKHPCSRCLLAATLCARMLSEIDPQ